MWPSVNDVMHQKRRLRFEKKYSWVPASEREGWLSELGVARRLCALQAPCVGWVESWRYKSSQHRKIVSLEKPLNSRWIKVSYLNRFREFCVFRFPMPISHISVSWVCYNTSPKKKNTDRYPCLPGFLGLSSVRARWMILI